MSKFLYTLLIALCFLPITAISQYNSFIVKKPYTQGISQPLEIVQIDFRENSTLVHLTLTNPSALGAYYYVSSGFILFEKETNQYSKLLNSYNIPLENVNEYAYLDKFGEKLNFTLEFEKVPESLTLFDLIENREDKNAFNFYGVQIDKNSRADDFIDLNQFLNDAPLKRVDFFYQEGAIVHYQSDPSGIIVAANMDVSKDYGKYYKINISIQNLTGESFTILPDKIRAFYVDMLGDNNIKLTKVLSHQEYMKKVSNRQNWNSFAVSMAEGLAASSAGYSNSTTYTTSYGYDGYGYSSSFSTSETTTYNTAAANIARQNAINNINNFENSQFEIKNTLNEGYLKRHTLPNETEYIGYINIPFSRKIKVLKVIVPINGKEFEFIF